MSAINRLLFAGATVALTTLAAAGAEARPFRVTQIPNGADFGCTSCHTSPGGGARNGFGTAVSDGFTSAPSSAPAGWGPVLAGLDSDGDGFTNGEELGDPDGTWTVGDPNPTFDATDPGDSTSFPAVTDPDAGSDTGADSGTDATEDTGTEDAATSADTGTGTGATDDAKKASDDGCSAAGNGSASLLGLLGLALLARRRRA